MKSVKCPGYRAVVNASLAVTLVSAGQAMAASATWVANPADANWTNPANWSTNAVPGIVNPTAAQIATDGQDIVTFNTATAGGIGSAANPIVIDAQRTVKSFVFDGGAGAYTFSGGPFVLSATRPVDATTNAPGDGSITLNAGVTTAQTFAAPIAFRLSSSTNGAYALVNNAASSAATLNIASLTNLSANTRPFALTLDGSNTGFNRIDSLTDNFSTAIVNGAIQIIKNGAGTWVLTGPNTITQQTSNGGVASAIVNAGTLAVQNAGSLGTLTAPNIRVTGTGTLRIDGVTLNNNGVTLDQTGTILANGSTTLASLPVAATATNVNLVTTNAADVLTAGGTTAVSGGAAGSTIHAAGPGTVALNLASTYVGSYSVDAGTLQVNNATALGAAGTANVLFGAGSTGVLQLNGVSTTVNGLQGTAAGSAVESGSGNNTLTVANVAANQYGGTIRDGAGQVAVVKNNAGVLALTGNSTYTAGTTINAGSLLANNASGSATGTGAVAVNAGSTLGGNGTAGGAVTVNASGRIAPGAAAGQVGTLRVGSLTLGSGSQLDYDLASPASADQVIVNDGNGLTINGGQFNFNGATSTFTTNGVYNLIGYTGTINGTGVSALSLNAVNQNGATNTYTFGTGGGYVTLTIAGTGTTISYWNANADGNWSSGPWTPSQPNSVGAFASFGGGGTPITANRTITVDAPKTVGTIAFNQPNGFSYTIAGANPITLNNGATSAFITDTAGSHTITAPLALTGGVTAAVTQAADTLTIGGAVSGVGPLTKSGLGTVVLNGDNTYTGGTNLAAGTLRINSATSLGDAGGNATFTGGGLQLAADIVTARNYLADSDVRIDTNGFNLTHNGTITQAGSAIGGLTKSGSGTLTLSGSNTYVGATTVTGGTLSVAATANLGSLSQSTTLNLSGGATLVTTGNVVLANGAVGTNNKNVVLGTGGATFAPATGTTVTVAGAITGPGRLTKSDAGQLTIRGATGQTNTFSGGTLITGGTLFLGDIIAAGAGAGLGTGPVTLNGGTLNLRYSGNAIPNTASGFGNALVVDAGATGTYIAGGRMENTGALTGGGTLNVQTDYVRSNYAGNWSAFTGQINITNGPNGGEFRVNNGNGYGNARINLGTGVNMNGIVNFGAGGATYAIGELSGVAGGFLSGGPTGGRTLTWSIGGLNTSSQFDGIVRNSTGILALTKVGTGTLTLTGANTYTGLTTVSGGTLVVGAAGSPALLSNTATGVNIGTGTLVLGYAEGSSPVATIRGLLTASFQDAATPGVMETGQIRSSTATLTKGLGYRDDGVGAVTIKATLFGDADLDGGVSINDFNALAGNFGQSVGKVWTDGDFDYDGGVSINDFNLLAGGFGQSLPAGSALWSGLLAFAAANDDLVAFEAVTGVPEPTTLGLLAAGATLGLRRRRRA